MKRNTGTRLAEELSDHPPLIEGAAKTISVNAFERNPVARALCIHQYGWACQVCGFDFPAAYGEVGKDFIHVHHLQPLSGTGTDYVVDPIRDMVPICPNCHAIIHRRNPPYSIEEVKAAVQVQYIYLFSVGGNRGAGVE